MSNLQIGLAIAGGVVLAAVVAHSTWTSRKNKPRQADPMVQDTLIESADSINVSWTIGSAWRGLFLREVHVLCATTAASTTPPAIAKPI